MLLKITNMRIKFIIPLLFATFIMVGCHKEKAIKCESKAEEEIVSLDEEIYDDETEDLFEEYTPIVDDTTSAIYQIYKEKKIVTKATGASDNNLQGTLFDLRDLPVNILVKESPDSKRYLTATRYSKKGGALHTGHRHYYPDKTIIDGKIDETTKSASQVFYLKAQPLTGQYDIVTRFDGCNDDYYLIPVTDKKGNMLLSSSTTPSSYYKDYSFIHTSDDYFEIETNVIGCDDPDNPTPFNVWNHALKCSNSNVTLDKFKNLDQQKFEIVPVEDFEFVDIEYHLDKSASLQKIPDFIVSCTILNSSSIPQTKTTTFSSTASYTSTHSFSESIKIGISGSATFGIPIFAKESITISAESTSTFSLQKTETTSDTRNYNFPVTAPAGTRIVAEAHVTRYKLKVPYTARLKGKTTGRVVSINGVWEGVDCTDILYSIKEYDLETDDLISTKSFIRSTDNNN